MIEDEAFDPTVSSSETVFEGKVWDVRREVFEYNGGNLTRDFVDHTGAVAILALNDAGEIFMIKQYRHPVRHRMWEIPAGLLDVRGENPLDAAKRELAEEADLVASEWHLLSEFHTSPGGSDEIIRVYLARGLTDAAEVFDRAEEEADMETRWVPLDEALDAVLARRLHNPSTTIAILEASIARSRDWSTLGEADQPWPRHRKLTAS
jgi:8-oxo-dGTP pyrophosphatase MutT (NUDIX family)